VVAISKESKSVNVSMRLEIPEGLVDCLHNKEISLLEFATVLQDLVVLDVILTEHLDASLWIQPLKMHAQEVAMEHASQLPISLEIPSSVANAILNSQEPTASSPSVCLQANCPTQRQNAREEEFVKAAWYAIAAVTTADRHKQAVAISSRSWQVAMDVKSTLHKDVEHSVPTPWEAGHGNCAVQQEHVLSTMEYNLLQPAVFVTREEVEVNAS
jgi:hypothetical protein